MNLNGQMISKWMNDKNVNGRMNDMNLNVRIIIKWMNYMNLNG